MAYFPFQHLLDRSGKQVGQAPFLSKEVVQTRRLA
jgi:hypothetical protein